MEWIVLDGKLENHPYKITIRNETSKPQQSHFTHKKRSKTITKRSYFVKHKKNHVMVALKQCVLFKYTTENWLQ